MRRTIVRQLDIWSHICLSHRPAIRSRIQGPLLLHLSYEGYADLSRLRHRSYQLVESSA